MTFDVSVEKYMESTDKWVNVATGNVTVASGNTAGQSAALIVAASVDTGALYRVTATYANGSMTSANFTA